MKAQLIFTLPEEREEFENAVNAGKVFGAMSEFREWIRGQLKYGSEDLDIKTLEKVQDEFHSYCEGLHGF